MRSIRSVRLGMSALLATSASLGVAHADSITSKCETTLTCSSGQAPLKASGRDGIDTTVSTGWLPACPSPTPTNPHCSDHNIQVQIDVALDATDDTSKPLWEVDMNKGAILDVTWPDKQNFTVKMASGGATDGSFTVTHSLAPTVHLWLGSFLHGLIDIEQDFPFDASALLNYAPGANFNYIATGTSTFTPWALDGANLTVQGPSLDSSELFSAPLQDLPGISSLPVQVDGTVALSATTSPNFSYKTTKVTLGSSTLSSASATAQVKMQNLDALDVLADVEGEISVKGTMKLLPNVTITQLGSVGGLDINLPIDVGADQDYTNENAPIKVVFPKATVHVPLPNVAVPSDALDFGTIKTGTDAQKTVTVQNTGELGAVLSIQSSDASFTVEQAQNQMGPKSTYDLVVKFSPKAAGDAKATITVTSNDPDAPVQTFDVKGSAAADAPVGGTTSAPPAKTEPGGNSGCGCRVTSPNASDTAGSSLLVFGALAFVRRRRRRS